MLASVVAEALERFGPFVVPVVLFTGGAAVYALLWLFYRWRDGAVFGRDSTREN